MVKKKSKVVSLAPFSKESERVITNIILEKDKLRKEAALNLGSLSQEKLWQNLPELKTIVFLHNALPETQKMRILNMLQSMLAASQVKIVYVSTSVRAMFTLPREPISQKRYAVFRDHQNNSPILFKNVRHFLDATSPELVMLFSNEAHKTDDIHCFQVKKDEIFFTSKPGQKMEDVCTMDFPKFEISDEELAEMDEAMVEMSNAIDN